MSSTWNARPIPTQKPQVIVSSRSSVVAEQFACRRCHIASSMPRWSIANCSANSAASRSRGEVGMVVVLVDVLVQLVGHALLHRRCSPGVQSNVALVELGDAHARDLAFADRQSWTVRRPPRSWRCNPVPDVRCQLPDSRRFECRRRRVCRSWPSDLIGPGARVDAAVSQGYDEHVVDPVGGTIWLPGSLRPKTNSVFAPEASADWMPRPVL